MRWNYTPNQISETLLIDNRIMKAPFSSSRKRTSYLSYVKHVTANTYVKYTDKSYKNLQNYFFGVPSKFPTQIYLSVNLQTNNY